MDAPAAALTLSFVPLDIIRMVLQYMGDEDRFTCALVCKAWAKAAAAATRSAVIRRPSLQTFNCLPKWLQNHGHQLLVLQLHDCGGAALIALPCAQLQDLLLQGGFGDDSYINIDSRVWGEIAAATNLTSVSLSGVQTGSQQADVVAALTALPDLEQLTWCDVQCSGEQQLSDSLLLQHLTKLTGLKLQDFSAAALEHLSSLTKLQNLSASDAEGWAAVSCPGLGELKALTKLYLCLYVEDIPAGVGRLTALQELCVKNAALTSLISLQALTGLTQLHVGAVEGLPLDTPPLQLPRLQHLELFGLFTSMPVSILAGCTQLKVLELWGFNFSCPGSLVASTMLQHLVLDGCGLSAADGVAGGPVSWQQVLPSPGRLPHLSSLQLSSMQPDLQLVDMECVVACCSSLQALHLATLRDSFVSALAQLSGLTRLKLWEAGDEQCGALAQLTGLRELTVDDPRDISAAGLRQLAALEQLTSLGFGSSFDPCKVSHVLQEHCSRTLLNQVRIKGVSGQL